MTGDCCVFKFLQRSVDLPTVNTDSMLDQVVLGLDDRS